MKKYSFFNAFHPKELEYIYKKYLKNPYSVESSFRYFFRGFDFGIKNKGFNLENFLKEIKIINLINNYKIKGHIFSDTNPIFKKKKNRLTLKKFNLSKKDLKYHFKSGRLFNFKNYSLQKILNFLNVLYLSKIGIEYMHIQNNKKIKWIENWFNKKIFFSLEEKKRFLKKIHEAISFEDYIDKKFIGKKRFSIEGMECVLPALEEIIIYSADYYNIKNIIIGMAHRGRLNILSNILKKPYSHIFSEFQDKKYENNFYGDVKYHMGYDKIIKSPLGRLINLILPPNPSHLETIDSIVEGISRAKINNNYEKNKNKILPILIHGDAAISAQGIIYEIIQMSGLEGYKTGGTIHIIINNQIGFTTDYFDARTSFYCTDIGKVISSPILHINGDDIESVIYAIKFAVDFRIHYNQDVFIDIIGYRKYGHNEGDDPKFTQPKMYEIISNKKNLYSIYREKLEKEGIIIKNFCKKIENDTKLILEKEYEKSKFIKRNKIISFLKKEWRNFSFLKKKDIFKKINTSYPRKKLIKIGKKIFTIPKGIKIYKKLKKIFKINLKKIENNNLNWGTAELLAYGTLLEEGYNIRLSGQDVKRGTFSHRHAVIKSENNEEEFILLNNIKKGQGIISIYNSPLSEYGVLGFDYGYAMISPNTLTIWEAQFGDFSNGAQIIIDQYLSSAEDKWKIQNGLVIFLPHGYEGQGAEHSSARIERYLQLCAKYNMFIANCTTPSNFYHILRRQMKFKFRKPLILFTPKSLLRHNKCISSLSDLSYGNFQEILDDLLVDKNIVKKIIFCSGKIYYELLEKRIEFKEKKTALIRIEQLYPLNEEKIKLILSKYNKSSKLLWVQEEPENMGAWSFLHRKLEKIKLKPITSSESSSPSTGSYKDFIEIQNKILEKAFL
jgi:2-oxoglutarate dehydrogenase E1 component